MTNISLASPKTSSSRSSEEAQSWHISPLHNSPPLMSGPTFPPRPNMATFPSLSDGTPKITRQSTSSTKREKSCDWDGRDDEECVFESESEMILCESSNSKDPTRDTINGSECKVFDYYNEEYTVPTRRIVVRNIAHPQLFFSCCKPNRLLGLFLNSNIASFALTLWQGCLLIMCMS